MDPNGTWDAGGVRTDRRDGRLVYRDSEGNEDSWDLYGVTEDGEGLYALDGWVWVGGRLDRGPRTLPFRRAFSRGFGPGGFVNCFTEVCG